jgi:mRNA-degrading endonuclease HigB of HigAB toxin-antitoxin module
MIELKKINYFTGDTNDVARVVSKIVSFLELDGVNPVFFTTEHNKSIGKLCNIVPRIEFKKITDFNKKIHDNNLVFRANLFVLDFWGLDKSTIVEYKKLISDIDAKFIIMAKEYIYSDSEDVSDFHVLVKYSSNGNTLYDFKSEIFITNNIDGWKSTIDELKKSYIRDKKINGLLGDSEID